MTDEALIKFESLPLLDIYGDPVGELTGEFTAEQLSDHLVYEWVAYVECHRKCSRADSCKFTVPVPGHKGVYEEIPCGVKSTFIKNFIKLAFPVLLSADEEQQEKLLGAAYYLSEYVIDSEVQIGMLLNDNTLEWLGEYAPNFFGRLVHLRETLNKAGQMLAFVPNLYDRKPILLVEGQSEKIFLDKLRESHFSWFTDVRVEVYGGTGNAHPRRIQMRLEKYIEDGYVCYMQGDRDGKEKETFQKLIKQGAVKEDNVFEFVHDFETSVPPSLFLKVLQNMGHLEEVKKEEFSAKIDGSKSTVKLLSEHYRLDIEPLKTEIADELGWVMGKSRFRWYQDEGKFMENTELGRFLDFVIKMK
jgi:hypothetical protein